MMSPRRRHPPTTAGRRDGWSRTTQPRFTGSKPLAKLRTMLPALQRPCRPMRRPATPLLSAASPVEASPCLFMSAFTGPNAISSRSTRVAVETTGRSTRLRSLVGYDGTENRVPQKQVHSSLGTVPPATLAQQVRVILVILFWVITITSLPGEELSATDEVETVARGSRNPLTLPRVPPHARARKTPSASRPCESYRARDPCREPRRPPRLR